MTGRAAELEILSGLFLSAAEQMRRTLVRTAFNAVIYEVLDFGISIADRRGRMVAEAAGITSFNGANDYALKMLLQKLDLGTLRPGDVVMLNYPYWNSAHASDALVMAPVFIDGVGDAPDMYLCVRAHWLDIGAKDAGYVIDSTDIHQEGLILPGVRIVKEGKLDEDLWKILEFNSRLPDAIRGDFGAQVASLRTGERCVRDIFHKFGKAGVLEGIDDLIDHAAWETRQAMKRFPRGVWSAEEWLDDDGIRDRKIRMAVEVTIDEERFVADFKRLGPHGGRPGQCAVWNDRHDDQDLLQVPHVSELAKQPRPLPRARGKGGSRLPVSRRLSGSNIHALDEDGRVRTDREGTGSGGGMDSNVLGRRRTRFHGRRNPRTNGKTFRGQQ